jgi:hypothetical protein
MTNSLQFSEAQRYDRQIRVWGAEAQSRIQSSRVLVCGMRCLNPEVFAVFVCLLARLILLRTGCEKLDLSWC